MRASPLIAGDVVYIASHDGFLYALNLADGEEVWQSDVGGQMTSPLIDDRTLYVNLVVGEVIALVE